MSILDLSNRLHMFIYKSGEKSKIQTKVYPPVKSAFVGRPISTCSHFGYINVFIKLKDCYIFGVVWYKTYILNLSWFIFVQVFLLLVTKAQAMLQ